MVSTARLCVICKGSKLLCGNPSCPLLSRIRVKSKIQISTEFFGSGINVFVGRTGYPNLYVGPLAVSEYNEIVDNPVRWFGSDYNNLVELRSMTVRAKNRENIYSKARFIQEI